MKLPIDLNSIMGCATSSLNVKAEKGIDKCIRSDLKISVKCRQVGGANSPKVVGSGGFTPKSSVSNLSRNQGKKPLSTNSTVISRITSKACYNQCRETLCCVVVCYVMLSSVMLYCVDRCCVLLYHLILISSSV